jgi:hypothetical protein
MLHRIAFCCIGHLIYPPKRLDAFSSNDADRRNGVRVLGRANEIEYFPSLAHTRVAYMVDDEGFGLIQWFCDKGWSNRHRTMSAVIHDDALDRKPQTGWRSQLVEFVQPSSEAREKATRCHPVSLLLELDGRRHVAEHAEGQNEMIYASSAR